VVVEVRGTASEQDRQPVFTLDHRHQHGGGPDFPITAPKVAVSLSHGFEVAGLGKIAERSQSFVQARRRVNSFDETQISGLYLRGSSARDTTGVAIAFDRHRRYSIGGRNRFAGIGVYVAKAAAGRHERPADRNFQGELMKIRFAALFGALMLVSASAFAFHCRRT